MPRQRPMAARQSSDMSSTSGASFHSAHESRRSMYPGMQARVSDGEASEPSRRSRTGLSDIIEGARHDVDSESSRYPSRRHPGILGRASDPGESDSGYVSSGRRSYPSQTSLSDRSLDPWDSISNQGSNLSDNEHIPRNGSPRSYSNTHSHYTEDEYSRRGAYAMRNGSNGPAARHGTLPLFREPVNDASYDYYSSRIRPARSHGGGGMSSRHESYDADYEEPFAPRSHSGRSTGSRHDAYDDEEESFTPRQGLRHGDEDEEEEEEEEEEEPFNLRRYRSRYGDEAAREVVREDRIREEYRRNGWD